MQSPLKNWRTKPKYSFFNITFAVMQQWLNKSNKKYLTWVISFVLLIGLSAGVSTGSSSPSVRNPKQTEVTVRSSQIKATHLRVSSSSKKVAHFVCDGCFSTRINKHSQLAALKLNDSKWYAISKLPSIGLSHLKEPNTKEDAELLKS